VRVGRIILVLVSGALLTAGCTALRSPGAPAAQTRTPAASADTSQTLPGGGQRATTTTNGVELSAEVTTDVAAASKGIPVRLVLKNLRSTPAHWDHLRAAYVVRVLPGNRVYGGEERGWAHGVSSLTLASGESTTTSTYVTGVPPGLYGVRGGIVDVSGKIPIQTPDVTVRVVAR
jgi:hypothetical protein